MTERVWHHLTTKWQMHQRQLIKIAMATELVSSMLNCIARRKIFGRDGWLESGMLGEAVVLSRLLFVALLELFKGRAKTRFEERDMTHTRPS